MKQKSFMKNVVFNFIYTGLNLLFPLITAPYISRTLGASNLGKVNFATTIVNWFVLFAAFGITTYGVREVAKIRNEHKKLSQLFSEIFIINGILCVIVSSVYFFIIFHIPNFKAELPLFIILSLTIILNFFSIDWFYQGIEEYRYITIRSAIFKVVSLIFIFLFVTKEEHYIIYGLISVLSTSLSGVLNFFYSKKYVIFQFKDLQIIKHLKSLSVFFIHTFIVNVYTNLDQVFLGFFVNSKTVAFMNRSNVIVSMAISISTAISNVALPRASYYIENDFEKFKKLLNEIPNYILWITIPTSMGTICFSSNIMYILGGREFLNATTLLQFMSIMIIFSPLSTYLQYQVIVASGREKLGLYCSIVTSLLSVILNILLIPLLGFLGAGIVRVIAELSAVSMRLYIAKKKLNFSEINFVNKSTITYLFSSIIMGALLLIIKSSLSNPITSFIVGIISGVVLYITILLLMREKVTTFFLQKLKRV